MRKRTKKKIRQVAFLAVAALVLYVAFNLRLGSYFPHDPFNTCHPPRTTDVITDEEMADFFAILNKYNNITLSDAAKPFVSMYSGAPSTALPWNVQLWFMKNCWKADRFFYVEQRLRQIVHTSYLMAHSKSVMATLQNLINDESDDSKIEAYRQMIEIHRNLPEIEKITDEELRMVSGKEDLILNLLNHQSNRHR